MDAIADALRHGHTQVIDADLSNYFDSIPHAKLLATVAERVVDGAVLALIKQWLKAPVMSGNEGGKTACVGGGKGSRRGTPQGGVISPLLSNIYLHLMDRIWQRHELARKLQARLVRYADDFVVMCRNDVAPPLSIIRSILGRLDLELNEGKTKIVNAANEGFCFLGFSVKMNVASKGVSYPHISPSNKAVVKVETRLREITASMETH